MKRLLEIINKNPLFSSSLIVLIGSNLGNFINFLTHITIARHLLPSQYGLFQSLISIISILGIILMGFSLTIVNRAGVLSPKKLTTFLTPLVRTILKIHLFISLSILFLYPWLKQTLSIDHFSTHLILIFIVFFTFIPMVFNSILRAKLKFLHLSLTSIFASLAKLITAWALLSLFTWQVSGALLAVLVSILVSFFFSFLWSKKFLSFPIKPHTQTTYVPKRFTLMATITNLGLISLISTDIILARYFLSPNISGLYSAAASLAKIVFFAVSPILTVTFPLFSSSSFRTGSGKLLKQAGLLISSLIIITFTILKANPKSIINLVYGHQYLAAAAILPQFSLLILLYTLFYLLIQFLLAKKSPTAYKISISTAILQIALISLNHSTPTLIIQGSIISLIIGLTASLIAIRKIKK